jgi:hypothetical protein
MTDLFDRVFCGYLAANILVAANLAEADRRKAAREADYHSWSELVERFAAIGCRLQRCHLDSACDGECGCEPGVLDRDAVMHPIDDNRIPEFLADMERGFQA